jgi:dihydrofolate reductase
LGKIIYAIQTSLDGYISDEQGGFDWAEPQKDVHTFINEMQSKMEVLLLGRKMYKILEEWEKIIEIEKMPDYIKDYEHIWKKTKKIVFSSTIHTINYQNTILKSKLIINDISELKESVNADIGIGGSDIASQVMESNLIDEISIFVYPVIVGNGKKWINVKNENKLELKSVKKFDRGVMLLNYKTVGRR